MKKKNYFKIVFIFLLAFLAANFVYPKYFNSGVDFLNSKIGLKLPHFWEKPFMLGLDLEGGSHLVYQANLAGIEDKEKPAAMDGLRDTIERRINLFGVVEPAVQIQKDRLIIELAGVQDIQRAKEIIGQTALLEFKEKREESETKAILDKQKEIEGKTSEELQEIPDWFLGLQDPYFKSTSLTGKYLKKSELGFDQNTGSPIILIQFNDEGAKIFEDLTEKNTQKPLAIYIDEVPISAPIVQEKISGGRAQITGGFSVQEAKNLVINLNAGALPIPITPISQQTVGPALGRVSLEKSFKAGLIGFLAVILFMVLFYRLPGLAASLALLIYIVLVLAVFKLIPVTLTLAGIAGFLLSIGMAVDANILIFSRMREEFSKEKSFAISLSEGFSRAWPSIRDSNFNSLIVCAILFGFATSFIKGFALTLAIGILLSMFSAIFITRAFLNIFDGTKFEKIKPLW